MWGILVGIALGALQVLALKALVNLIMKSGSAVVKLIAVLLIFVKIAVIVLILYLVSTVSLVHVVWAAGGMLIGLLTVSAVIIFRRKKTEKDEHIGR